MTQKRISRRRFLKDLSVTCTCGGLLVNPITARYAMGQNIKNDAAKDVTNMEYRPLGRTGLMVSAVSFGVMRLTEPAVLYEALEKGINYFDTAHVYQRGKNEDMLGSVLKEYGRQKVFIATKIPPYARFLGMNKLNSQSAMEKSMETSLKRLQTDYVDVLFLHNIKNPAWPANDDMLSFCEKMKRKGMARFVGISLHTEGKTYVDTVTEAVKTGTYDVILATLNFMSPQQEIDVLKHAHNKNVGVVAMKTQAGGYSGDNKHLNQHQAALRWVLDLDFVSCAIPGMVNRRQLAENVNVIGTKMGLSDRKKLAAYYDAVKDRYCLRCGTCKALCRQAVEIPSIHRALMYWEGYEDYKLGRTTYRKLSAKENALACMSCAAPTCTCKNGIHIKERMRYAHANFA
jgi:uncharacterized protein